MMLLQEASHPLVSDAPPTVVAEASEDALSFGGFLRRSTTLSTATIVNAASQFLLGIVVARALGPAVLGVVGFVGLWQLYASLAKPGITSAAQREVAACLARGNALEAVALQNISLTAEGMFVLLVAGVMVVAALVQPTPLLRHGLLIGAAAFVVSQAADFVTGLHLIRQRFSVLAKATLLSVAASAAFVLSTITWLAVYTPLLKIAVVAAATLIGYRMWAPPLGLRVHWDGRTVWRLLLIGLPLSIQTFFCWAFRSVDQTAVAAAFPMTDLGYFTFAKQCLSIGVLLVVNLVLVVYPSLWSELERAEAPQVLGPKICRLLCWFFLTTCALVSFAQAAFGAFVHWVVPNYVSTIGLFERLAFLLAVGTIQNVPVFLLLSATINRQSAVTVVWGCGLALYSGVIAWVVRAGWGLNGIVLCSVAAHAMISVALLALAHRYIVTGWRSGLSLYGWLGGQCLVTGAVFALYQLGPFSYGGTSPVATVLVLRTALAVSVWGALAWVVWRGGWSGVLSRIEGAGARLCR